MAWTNWHSAQSITFLETEEIAWAGSLNGPVALTSNADLVGNPNSYGVLQTLGTSALLLTGWQWNIRDATVTGVEVRTHIARLARIQDRVVQLWDGAGRVGENRANLRAADVTVYGGERDAWGVAQMDVNSPSWGLVLDLQPHTVYPSANRAIIYSIEMRLAYE